MEHRERWRDRHPPQVQKIDWFIISKICDRRPNLEAALKYSILIVARSQIDVFLTRHGCS